ncbi:hypothetical protein B0T20DRAFT_405420 [Sordaria brevicollis]|uniref:Uncharacterized protein n=1 Tax=Sordaria brevicollis TaxID=83679 RepID=A0AAE0UEW4_SORBR|nr:hypothetical protein B0T20DRAFT_405420 [Sordaria brevicollis]
MCKGIHARHWQHLSLWLFPFVQGQEILRGKKFNVDPVDWEFVASAITNFLGFKDELTLAHEPMGTRQQAREVM